MAANLFTWNPTSAPADASNLASIAVNSADKVASDLGELGKFYADQDQREWDRAYKQAIQDEAAREFNENYALNQDKFKLSQDRLSWDKETSNRDYAHKLEREKVEDARADKSDRISKNKRDILSQAMYTKDADGNIVMDSNPESIRYRALAIAAQHPEIDTGSLTEDILSDSIKRGRELSDRDVATKSKYKSDALATITKAMEALQRSQTDYDTRVDPETSMEYLRRLYSALDNPDVSQQPLEALKAMGSLTIEPNAWIGRRSWVNETNRAHLIPENLYAKR